MQINSQIQNEIWHSTRQAKDIGYYNILRKPHDEK